MAGTRKTPLPGFLFGVKITGAYNADYNGGTAYFRSVSGIKNDTDVTDYYEGGVTANTRKVIGVVKWPNLVLKQGFTGDSAIFMWKYKPVRCDGEIIQLGPDLEEICRWKFVNGYPVKWEGPDFDATKNDIAIESLEIAHEGLTFDNGQPAPEPPPEPEPPPPPPPPIDVTVNFPTGSSTVPKPNADLDGAAQTLKDNPDRKVKVEGDTDTVGSQASNQTLSQNRANSVKQYLIDGGTPAEQIVSATGYGKQRALDSGQPDNTANASWRRTKVVDA
jgi:phage tail-like protein